jgi:polyhydroxyalkanoate synthesis repressor PhaR
MLANNNLTQSLKEYSMPERDAPHIIKKYPNRRLYDTQTSTYITLVDVKRMVLEKDEFRVLDAKTNEDLTRSILLQIILEEESGGVPLFSAEMLAQIIRSYGHVMQGMLGSYLEKNMQAFADIQSDLAGGAQTDAEQKINSEVWQQLLAMQAPMMQGMMSNYIEQSRNMFLQMREIMASQTAVLFQSLGDGTLKPDLLKNNSSTQQPPQQPTQGES